MFKNVNIWKQCYPTEIRYKQWGPNSGNDCSCSFQKLSSSHLLSKIM